MWAEAREALPPFLLLERCLLLECGGELDSGPIEIRCVSGLSVTIKYVRIYVGNLANLSADETDISWEFSIAICHRSRYKLRIMSAYLLACQI